MQSWFIFSLFSIFVLAGAEISQKVSLSQKVNVSAITNNFYIWTLQGTVGIILAILLGQFSLALDTSSIIKLVLIGFIYFAGGTLYYTSYKGSSASISLILMSISVVISSTLGTILLGDVFTAGKIVGIILILLAIVFLNLNSKEKINRYNVFAMLGGVCFGVAFTIDKSFVSTLSPFMYLGLLCLTVALVSLILKLKLIIKETKTLAKKNFIPMIFASSFGSAFNLFTFFAYKNGANVGVADAMNNSSVFLVILAEVLFLKDRTNLKRKIISATMAILGIILIGVVK